MIADAERLDQRAAPHAIGKSLKMFDWKMPTLFCQKIAVARCERGPRNRSQGRGTHLGARICSREIAQVILLGRMTDRAKYGVCGIAVDDVMHPGEPDGVG